MKISTSKAATESLDNSKAGKKEYCFQLAPFGTAATFQRRPEVTDISALSPSVSCSGDSPKFHYWILCFDSRIACSKVAAI
jgi:hypothetical protein